MSEISKNFLKKCRKKQLRCQAIIEKDGGAIFDDQPTPNLVICNAGLSNGLSSATIFENFNKYGPIHNIHMLPGKSYCYIVYNDSTSSEKAYTNCNGLLNIAQDNKPIFLAYAQEFSLPQVELDSYTRPPGLSIIANIISKTTESLLINLVDNESENTENQSLKHRFVKHYGYEFRYDINDVDRTKPLDEKIPPECEQLFGYMEMVPDQLTVNCYNPGDGIPPHIDTCCAFEGPIISLSLGSDVVMEFRHADGRHSSVLLPQRSLTIMNDECRYMWTHGITPRKYDIIQTPNGVNLQERQFRVSYTFRKVNMTGKCTSNYPEMCKRNKTKEIDEISARKLEDLHVQQVYNNIAGHFSDTRHTPWPNVLKFINSFETGSILLDIGCGNGKNMAHKKDNFYIGCDNSIGLLDLCRDRDLEVFASNCMYLPFNDSIADGIISIAVIHHLATHSRRRHAIAEIVRLLRVGGRALIYVWAKDQNREDRSSYLKQDRKNRKPNTSISADSANAKQISVGTNVALTVHTNRKQFVEQDVLVPWKLKNQAGAVENNDNTEFLRYYHVFEENELKSLLESFDNVNIMEYYYDQGNWCVNFERVR